MTLAAILRSDLAPGGGLGTILRDDLGGLGGGGGPLDGAVATITNARVPLNTTWQQQVVRGRSDAWTIQVTSEGVPLDLSGAVVTLLCKDVYADPDSAAVITKSTTNGGIDPGQAPHGRLAIPFAPADTAAPAVPLGVQVLAFSVRVLQAGEEVDVSPPGATLTLIDSTVLATT